MTSLPCDLCGQHRVPDTTDPWDPKEQHIGKAEVALVDFATEIPAPSEPGPRALHVSGALTGESQHRWGQELSPYNQEILPILSRFPYSVGKALHRPLFFLTLPTIPASSHSTTIY